MEAMDEKIGKNLKLVNDTISKAKTEGKIEKNIKLLAVTKKRPIEQVQVLYNLGQRNLGENYVNELLEKAEKLPKDIQWYLIGHLQSNKAKKLLEAIPNIIIESVDSVKIAEELNKICNKEGIKELRVYIEVNISNSTTKTGADLKIIDDIAKEIIEKCPHLKLVGIMSLGDANNREQFQHMVKLKNEFCEKYKLDKEQFVASFGTSEDYENAILEGSDEIRVGHTLFQ